MDALRSGLPRLGLALLLIGALLQPASAQGRGGGRPTGLSGPTALPWPAVRPLPSSPEKGSTAPSGRESPVADTPTARAERESADPAAVSIPHSTKDARDEAATAAAPKEGSPASHRQRIEQLLREHPRVYERDPSGALMLKGEITVLLPEHGTAVRWEQHGFVGLRETLVWERRLLVLRIPERLRLEQALALARELAPDAELDFNHVLLSSGGTVGPGPLAGRAASAAGAGVPVAVGLIDEGPRTTPELPTRSMVALGCADPGPASGHGTVVATILVRQLREAGRQPLLHTADLRCGHGAVDAIAAALQAMDRARVPVVNLSAAGPDDRVLAAVVAGFLQRGHLLVAAVGNEGPAAAPLYPAAYPGVVAVSGVDRQGQVLVEAGRGPHVSFAALGVVEVDGGDGPRGWRGTSFAAPVVAAALALRLSRPDAQLAMTAFTELALETLGRQGQPRNEILGYGVVAGAVGKLAAIR